MTAWQRAWKAYLVMWAINQDLSSLIYYMSGSLCSSSIGFTTIGANTLWMLYMNYLINEPLSKVLLLFLFSWRNTDSEGWVSFPRAKSRKDGGVVNCTSVWCKVQMPNCISQKETANHCASISLWLRFFFCYFLHTESLNIMSSKLRNIIYIWLVHKCL